QRKSEVAPSPQPSSAPQRHNNFGMWGWGVAAGLFALLLLLVSLWRSSLGPQPNVQPTPEPAATATPPVASPPINTPGREKSKAETSPTPIPTAAPQVTPAESPAVIDRMPGEQFPATRLWMMTSWEIENLTLVQLRYAINEMYARHGADFLDKEIK